MKTFRSAAFAVAFLPAFTLGWILEEPVDYPKQLQKADFAGIVEVTKITETGHKKILYHGGVAFRELTLELKVRSPIKGTGDTLTCRIYREPTREELLTDGVSDDAADKILLNLGTDETLHLFPAHVVKGNHLLVYLRSEGTTHSPITGDLDSSHSLLRIAPSNLVNALSQKQGAAPNPTPNDTKPANRSPPSYSRHTASTSASIIEKCIPHHQSSQNHPVGFFAMECSRSASFFSPGICIGEPVSPSLTHMIAMAPGFPY